MKCRCCGSEVDIRNAVCDICGFSVIPDDQNDPNNDSDFVLAMARQFLARRFGNTAVELLCHQYLIQNGEVHAPETLYVQLCKAVDYKIGTTFYAAQNYESIPSDRNFSITVRGIGEDRAAVREVQFKPDKPVSHSRIGIEFLEGLRARFVVGEDGNVVYSEEFVL